MTMLKCRSVDVTECEEHWKFEASHKGHVQISNSDVQKYTPQAILVRRQWIPSIHSTLIQRNWMLAYLTSITTSNLPDPHMSNLKSESYCMNHGTLKTQEKETQARASGLKEDGQTSTICDRITQHVREKLERNERGEPTASLRTG